MDSWFLAIARPRNDALFQKRPDLFGSDWRRRDWRREVITIVVQAITTVVVVLTLVERDFGIRHREVRFSAALF
jgi:hypothetical protein